MKKVHHNLLLSSIYIFSILIYLVPISSHKSLLTSPTPILDEVHILSPSSNHDANPPPPLPLSTQPFESFQSFLSTEIQAISKIFQNDYWGRPMNSPSSHKSYRPFTVLSFRYIHFLFQNVTVSSTSNDNQIGLYIDGLYIQRVVNVIVHSCIVHLLSWFIPQMIYLPLLLLLGERVRKSTSTSNISKSVSTISIIITTLSQLLFILHPTHCEFVINIANRNHLLAILFGLLAIGIGTFIIPIDTPTTTISTASISSLSTKNCYYQYIKLMTIIILGLGCSETFLFFIPIIIVTWFWIALCHNIIITNNKKNTSIDQSKYHPSINDNDGNDVDSNNYYYQINRNEEEHYLNMDEKTCSITNKIKPLPSSSSSSIVLLSIYQTIYKLLPSLFIITILTMIYLSFRHYNNWLSIPNDLIRRAENPLLPYLLQHQQTTATTINPKMKYHINYFYILCIHIIKSLGMGLIDIIGLSHEYGYNCISEFKLKVMTGCENWIFYIVDDERIWIIIFVILFFGVVLIWFSTMFDDDDIEEGQEDSDERVNESITKSSTNKNNQYITMIRNDKKVIGVIMWIVFCIWILASLFPVSGFMKVGTFIADRLVGPSTVISSLFWGCVFTFWIIKPLLLVPQQEKYDDDGDHDKGGIRSSKCISFYQLMQFGYRVCVISTIFIFLSIKVYNRNLEWMTPKSLLESSLRVCPRSAKSHLEYSKIYSGLYYPQIYDLETSLNHLHIAEEIDHEYW